MSTKEELRTGRRVRNGKVQVFVPADPPVSNEGAVVRIMACNIRLWSLVDRLIELKDKETKADLGNVCFDLDEAIGCLKSAIEELTR